MIMGKVINRLIISGTLSMNSQEMSRKGNKVYSV